MKETDIPTLKGLISQLPEGRRLIAIAGAPGSGKSTLAESLVEEINRAIPGEAAILPMDGYHFDDMVLEARGHRPRKGAPHTYDVPGFAHMLGRLRRNEEAEIAVSVFDRELEIARAGARLIPQSVNRLIVEGNYLLLQHEPWSMLAPLFDMSVMIEVPEPVLEERLSRRWKELGLSPAEITAKIEANDMPNGRTVITESRAADYVIRSGA